MATAGRPRASSRAAGEHSVGENTEGTGSRPSPHLTARAQLPMGSAGKPHAPWGAAPKQLRGTGLPHGPPGGGPSRAPALTKSEDVRAGHPSSLTPRVYFQKHLLEECISKFTHTAINRPFFRVNTTQRPGNPPHCTVLLAPSNPGEGEMETSGRTEGPGRSCSVKTRHPEHHTPKGILTRPWSTRKNAI